MWFMIVLILLVLIFLVAAGFCFQSWRPATCITLIGVGLATIVFLFLAGVVLEAHSNWGAAVNKLTAEIETSKKKLARLRDGYFLQPGETPEAMDDLGPLTTDAAPPIDEPSTDTQPPPDEPPADAKQPEGKEGADVEKVEEKPADEKPSQEQSEAKPTEEMPAEEKSNELARRRTLGHGTTVAVNLQDESPGTQEEPKPEPPGDQPTPDEKSKDQPTPDDKQPEEKPADEKPEEKPSDDQQPQDKQPESKSESDEPPAEPPPADTTDVGGDDRPLATERAVPTKVIPGIRQLRHMLARARQDRGNVWRGDGKLAAGGTATFAVKSPDTDRQLLKDRTVYVFESDAKKDGIFLGEFKVTEVNGVNVTLAPTYPWNAAQQARVVGRDGEWLLCDQAPLDKHDVLADFRDPAKPSVTLSRDEAVKAFLPPKTDTQMFKMAKEYDDLAAEYLHDGQPASKFEGAPGDRVFHRVEILPGKEYEYEDPATKARTKVFQFGEAVLPKADADKLVKDGVARDLGAVYVRPLRSYDTMWTSTHYRSTVLTDRQSQTAARLATAKANTAAIEKRITERTKEKTELEEDRDKFQADLAAAKKHFAALSAQSTELLAQIKTAYNACLTLVDELARLHGVAAP